jgi:flagellar basal body-associated protein FliL
MKIILGIVWVLSLVGAFVFGTYAQYTSEQRSANSTQQQIRDGVAVYQSLSPILNSHQ